MDEHVREELRRILSDQRDRWWLPYSLWKSLSDEARTSLEREHGNAVGKGGGHQYGPASAISQTLAAEARAGRGIEVDKLESNGLSVGETAVSGNPTAIFRWCHET
jgi:hypothetical protein